MTGFGFLGHLHEMMDGRLSSVIYADQIPVFDGARECAEEFLLTAAGQKNRNHLEGYVQFEDVSFGMEEVLFAAFHTSHLPALLIQQTKKIRNFCN